MKTRLGIVETLARRNDFDHKLFPSLDVIMKHCHNLLLLACVFWGFLGMHVGYIFLLYVSIHTFFEHI